MSMYRKLTAVGLTAVVATILMGSFLASTAYAQPALPYKAWGSGLRVGAVVVAWKGAATEVGRATVDGGGNWSFDITPDRASNGDVIRFTLDGAATNQSVIFGNGLFPLPPGLSLTLAPATTAPAPAKTGNAGLGSTSNNCLAAVLALGAVTIMLAVGARAATRRS